MEFFEQLRLIVGDEHVGGFHHSNQHFAPFRFREIERDAFLVAAGQHPAPVDFRLGGARQMREQAPQIAAADPLDFENLGAKIRHHRRRRRPRDISTAVDYPEARENSAILHNLTPRELLDNFVANTALDHPQAIGERTCSDGNSLASQVKGPPGHRFRSRQSSVVLLSLIDLVSETDVANLHPSKISLGSSSSGVSG